VGCGEVAGVIGLRAVLELGEQRGSRGGPGCAGGCDGADLAVVLAEPGVRACRSCWSSWSWWRSLPRFRWAAVSSACLASKRSERCLFNARPVRRIGEVGSVVHACDVTHSHDQMKSAHPAGESDVRLKASNKR